MHALAAQRVPPQDRWKKEIVEQVPALPWELKRRDGVEKLVDETAAELVKLPSWLSVSDPTPHWAQLVFVEELWKYPSGQAVQLDFPLVE